MLATTFVRKVEAGYAVCSMWIWISDATVDRTFFENKCARAVD